jgi:hypothetical protein
MFVGISNKSKLDHRKKITHQHLKPLDQEISAKGLRTICTIFERNEITNMEHMTNMEKKKKK